MELVEQQCRLRRMEVFQKGVGSLDDAFKLATLQGEIAGLQTLPALLNICIEDAARDIRVIQQELEDNA